MRISPNKIFAPEIGSSRARKEEATSLDRACFLRPCPSLEFRLRVLGVFNMDQE